MKKNGKGNMDDKVFEDTNDAFVFDNERANQMKMTMQWIQLCSVWVCFKLYEKS